MQQQVSYRLYQVSPRKSKIMLEADTYADTYNEMNKKFIFFGVNLGILCLFATLGYWI